MDILEAVFRTFLLFAAFLTWLFSAAEIRRAGVPDWPIGKTFIAVCIGLAVLAVVAAVTVFAESVLIVHPLHGLLEVHP